MQEAGQVSVLDLIRSGRKCSRCGVQVRGGLVGPLSFQTMAPGSVEVPVAGIVVVLCSGCAADVEASVESYGESGDERGRRFFAVMRRFRAP